MEEQQDAVPNGGAWAAVLAAGMGCAAFAATVDLAERFAHFSDQLKKLDAAAGDLPGKSAIGILVWIISWVLLHLLFSKRTLGPGARISCSLLTILLTLASVVAVFPPFFEWVSRK